MAEKMTLNFLHPRTSMTYPAQVAPACTAKLALDQLTSPVTGPFLDPPAAGRPYQLVVSRLNAQLAPTQTMAQAGVVDGDVLEVRQQGQGA